MSMTLEKIHEDLVSIKKELDRVVAYIEEDDLKLTEEVKKQITESRKKPLSHMIAQRDIEKEFL